MSKVMNSSATSKLTAWGHPPVSTGTIRRAGSASCRLRNSASSCVKMSLVTTPRGTRSRRARQRARVRAVLPEPTDARRERREGERRDDGTVTGQQRQSKVGAVSIGLGSDAVAVAQCPSHDKGAVKGQRAKTRTTQRLCASYCKLPDPVVTFSSHVLREDRAIEPSRKLKMRCGQRDQRCDLTWPSDAHGVPSAGVGAGSSLVPRLEEPSQPSLFAVLRRLLRSVVVVVAMVVVVVVAMFTVEHRAGLALVELPRAVVIGPMEAHRRTVAWRRRQEGRGVGDDDDPSSGSPRLCSQAR